MELLKGVVRGSALPSTISDRNGHLVAVNAAFCELMGYSEAECLERKLRDFVHPLERQDAISKGQRVFRGEVTSHQLERHFVHKSGADISTRIVVTAIPGEEASGCPDLVFVQIIDIGDQQKAVSDLAESELRWKVAVKNAGQGVWDHNMETGERYLSSSWRSMRGIGRTEFVPDDHQSWVDSIHPADRDRVLAVVAQHNEAKMDEISYEYRTRHKDGHWIWVLSRGRVVKRDATGQPLRMIGTDTDITLLKEQAEEVQHLSHRLELALTASKVGVWDLNLSTMEHVWDDRMLEVFGLPSGQHRVQRGVWESLLHPEDREMAIDASRQAIKTQTGFAVDYRIVLQDGSSRRLRSRAAYVDDATSGARLVGVTWDVTEDYRRSEELRKANTLAEHRNTELESARKDLEYMSMHDALTGLPNRRHLDASLQSAGERDRGADDWMAILHIDLDRFKQINDTLGHAAGDAMLVHMAKVLRECVGTKGMVSRVGGDEFVILFDSAPDEQGLRDIAAEIISRAAEPLRYHNHECRSGVSIGIARSRGLHVKPAQLLVNADIALYRAKNAGRQRFEFFNETMQAEVVAQKKTADEILTGLERKEFFTVYQPQFNAKTLEISGVEALVRWNHPERGVLTPDQFLPVAEELNVVAQLDELVLDQALAAHQQWQALELGIDAVSVNVSARRLLDDKLLPSLQQKQIAPGCLSFELLESIFLDDQDDLLLWTIDQIREMGIGIEIDDFGTGHASILGLLQIGPSRLKIDRQLVAPISHSRSRRRLLKSIVDIGRSQDIDVVAEGVETMQQASLLRRLGCHALQGYAFSKPLPGDMLIEFVQSRRWLKAS